MLQFGLSDNLTLLPNKKVSDWSKLKAFEEKNLNVVQMTKVCR